MFELVLLLKAFIIGLAVAAPPIGGVGILCIRRSLDRGFLAGLSTGMGAATADGIFATAAVIGLSAVVGALGNFLIVLKVIGSVFMLYLGYKIFKSAPNKNMKDNDGEPRSLIWCYGSTFALTITSPVAVASFAAMFAGMGFTGSGAHAVAPIGVFLGSTAWWIILSFTMSKIGHRINLNVLKWVNIACGLILLLLGVLGIVLVLPISL